MVDGRRFIPEEALQPTTGVSCEAEDRDSLGEVVQLTSESDLIDFAVAFRRNSGYYLPEKEDEQRQYASVVLQRMTAVFPDASQILYFGIKDVQKRLVSTGRLVVQEVAGQKQGYLTSQTVDKSLRRQGLGKKMTDARIKMAKEIGCVLVTTEAETDNIPSLAGKLKDGFVINGLRSGTWNDAGVEKSWATLLMAKRIDDKKMPYQIEEPKGIREVSLSNLGEVSDLLETGKWVGVDLKSKGDKNSRNSQDWSLVLKMF